jgi:hypothetical protein
VRHSAFSAELRGRAKQALADAERAREEARRSGAGLFLMWRLRQRTDQLRRELDRAADGPAGGPADGPVDGQQAERLARKVNQLKQTTRSTISAARLASQRRRIRR